MVKLTSTELSKIRETLLQLGALCHLLDGEDPVAQLQRRCLTEDIRTRRNLRYLKRQCSLLAHLVDDRPEQ